MCFLWSVMNSMRWILTCGFLTLGGEIFYNHPIIWFASSVIIIKLGYKNLMEATWKILILIHNVY